ncbi:hypothetical protein [Flavobacterium sp.]|uniref:hypothetical protein n=1 Tax=Flavobacterium sp. TaxID=239 RepID=UPI002B4ADC12|nr:hypothetical protein [Flavobacterium sp.]HLF51515.1 hypothetical protein [Flavobacterium sp.]
MKKSEVSVSENGNIEIDGSDDPNPYPEDILEKAENAVLSDLPDKKRKKYQRDYGDRPENLRKPVSQMSSKEKVELKKWEISQLTGESEEKKDAVYTEEDLFNMGSIILPFFAARMPVYKQVSEDEFQKFGKIFTPLANKYASPYGQWKDEFNGLLFVFSFVMSRVNFEIGKGENAQ